MKIINKNVCSNGFTLIELMIVVAIIGIISLIAYPTYNDSIMKARRSDGRAAIMGITLAQAKLRGNCALYGNTLGAGNNCAGRTVQGNATSENGYYSVAISNATGNGYTLTATAQGVQAKDTDCPALTLTFNASNPKGLKAPTGCW